MTSSLKPSPATTASGHIPVGGRPAAQTFKATRFPVRTRMDWRMLLEWMLEDGVITPADSALIIQRFGAGVSRQHPLVRLAAANLTNAKTQRPFDTEGLTEWLANLVGLPYLRIDPLKVDVGRVADVMSVRYAEMRSALPIKVSSTEVVIATCEPFDADWTSEIESHTRKPVKLVIASPLELQRYTTEFFTLAKSVKGAVKNGATAAMANFEQLVELGKSNKQLDANDQSVVQVVDWLWQYAFDQRASDIHLEPRRDMAAIRFRIDGVLHTVYQMPMSVMNAMIARIKLLGRMDVVERRRPQDGRIKTLRPDGTPGQAGSEVEMRLSTLPTAFGEKMVMRIFDPDAAVKTVEQLGFGAHDSQRWQKLISQPHGIILVTGPTGSGKTTTLYSTLKRLATDEVNVSTIEDPIEMIEPSLNQTQAQPALDFSFAEGVRALMRQDPDIIMVGEIRDLETAEMAIQAALTGHLVFSTLHTNDAPSAITRLMDLGVPPYLLGATLIGVLAQRLARTLCPACKQPDLELSTERLNEAMAPFKLKGEPRPYKPVGCLDCRNTGFRGRAGLYELMLLDDKSREALHNQVDMEALRRNALADGMHPLRAAGIMKVAEGVTTLDEVLRTTPVWSTR
jgi:general secretion pathway protein E